MDENKKKDPASMVDGWMNEILEKLNIDIPSETDEIGADEQAVRSAGLTHPDDMELERIVQETIAENWGADFPEQTSENTQEPSYTRSFKAPKSQHITHNIPKDDPIPEDEPMPERKPKKGFNLFGIPHIISTILWLFIIVATGVSIGRLVWVCAADLLALGKTAQQVTITIEDQDDLQDVAEKLKQSGMIRYPQLFEMFANLTGKGDGILPGAITFSEQMVYDYNALINAMSYKGGSSVTVEVMIPEGYTCAQIFTLLEQKGVCDSSALEEYAANGELEDYWFLDGVERGHKYCLEGFMFPDTYEFYLKDEPRRVIEKFLNDFEYRFSDRMVDKFVTMNQKTGLNLTIRELVTLASIVEKEKANSLEGYSIASVFVNRLTHPGSYPFLNSDATIHYDTEYYSKGQLVTDAQINASPYNTYTQTGLPAGPIANPGLSSLDAAMDPEDTKYYYFVFDKEAGVHRFSKTLAEHSAWVGKLGLG